MAFRLIRATLRGDRDGWTILFTVLEMDAGYGKKAAGIYRQEKIETAERILSRESDADGGMTPLAGILRVAVHRSGSLQKSSILAPMSSIPIVESFRRSRYRIPPSHQPRKSRAAFAAR